MRRCVMFAEWDFREAVFQVVHNCCTVCITCKIQSKNVFAHQAEITVTDTLLLVLSHTCMGNMQ